MMTERPLPSLAEVNWPAVVAAATAGYALGSLSPAAGAARLRGADLRGSGSGNPGATNAARTMGVKVGVIVGALDVAKGYAPVWYFDRYGNPCGQVAGLAAVLGHVTSPLLKGRGGKRVPSAGKPDDMGFSHARCLYFHGCAPVRIRRLWPGTRCFMTCLGFRLHKICHMSRFWKNRQRCRANSFRSVGGTAVPAFLAWARLTARRPNK